MPNDFEDISDDDGWVPDDALNALIMEKELHPGESNSKTAKRLMDENAPIVAQSLIRLAVHSKSERTRLDAGKYVLDRVLGRIGEEVLAKEDSPINSFINEITEYVNANGD